MAQFILTNAKVFADQYDVSGYLSAGETQKASDMHDVTPFGATEHRFAPGLQGGNWSMQGFTEFGTTPPAKIEKIMNTLQGQRDLPLTVVPEGPTIGNVAIFLPAAFHGYDFGGLHGAPNTFNWNGGTSKWQPISGFIDELNTTARTATGNSGGIQLGAVAANQFLYAAVHLTAVSGTTPTLNLVVQSDTTGFPSPVTALTFSQMTAAGSAIARVAGPLTDDFFRFQWTIAGTTPSFTFAAVFGIAG